MLQQSTPLQNLKQNDKLKGMAALNDLKARRALSLFLSFHSRIPSARALLSFSNFWMWRFLNSTNFSKVLKELC